MTYQYIDSTNLWLNAAKQHPSNMRLVFIQILNNKDADIGYFYKNNWYSVHEEIILDVIRWKDIEYPKLPEKG